MILNVLMAILFEIIALVKRSNKLVFVLFLTFIWILFWGNISSPDRYTYINMYKYFNNESIRNVMEPGFQFLVYIARTIGLSFQQFLAFYFGIALFIFGYAIKMIANNKVMVLGLYFLFPFILDADQIRSFMGACLVVLGFALMVKKDRKGVWLFLITCIISGFIQQSCFLYVLYLLCFKSERFLKKVILIVGILLVLGRNLIVWLASKFSFIDSLKVSNYLLNIGSRDNWWIYIFFNLLIMLGTIYLINKYSDVEGYDMRVIAIVRNINIISIIFVMLIYVSPHFERLLRPALIIDYIYVTNLIPSGKITKKYQLRIIVILYAIITARFLMYYFGAGKESYLIPIFQNGFKLL